MSVSPYQKLCLVLIFSRRLFRVVTHVSVGPFSFIIPFVWTNSSTWSTETFLMPGCVTPRIGLSRPPFSDGFGQCAIVAGVWCVGVDTRLEYTAWSYAVYSFPWLICLSRRSSFVCWSRSFRVRHMLLSSMLCVMVVVVCVVLVRVGVVSPGGGVIGFVGVLLMPGGLAMSVVVSLCAFSRSCCDFVVSLCVISLSMSRTFCN